jgi:hypothetical protein
LAVPGVLFYNWSSRLKAEHDRGISAAARSRLPAGVFQAPPASGRLVNPIGTSTSAAAGLAPGAAPASAKVPTAAPTAANPASAARSLAPTPAAPAAPNAASAPPGSAPATTSSAVFTSTAASAAVVLPRDPMISPLDIVRIREAAEAAERQRRLLEEANRPKKPKPKRERAIEEDIDLEGIVTKDGRSVAIVNNNTLSVGTTFTVEGHPGLVRIVSISVDTVVFKYRNRPFRKTVSKD